MSQVVREEFGGEKERKKKKRWNKSTRLCRSYVKFSNTFAGQLVRGQIHSELFGSTTVKLFI